MSVQELAKHSFKYLLETQCITIKSDTFIRKVTKVLDPSLLLFYTKTLTSYALRSLQKSLNATLNRASLFIRL